MKRLYTNDSLLTMNDYQNIFKNNEKSDKQISAA
jgi:hypothetical protein